MIGGSILVSYTLIRHGLRNYNPVRIVVTNHAAGPTTDIPGGAL